MFRFDEKNFARRKPEFKHVSAAITGVVILLLVLVFHHSTGGTHTSSNGGFSGRLEEEGAALACLKLQDSLGDFQANFSSQAADPVWESSGLSQSATIELDVVNSDNSDDSRVGEITTTVVIGRVKSQANNVGWIHTELHNITNTAIYVVDDPEAQGLHLERNHGRESIVYLKYIIDHFDNLNDITFFFHPAQFTWHNNMLLKEDSAAAINRMSRAKILRDGYVNSRCDAWPGCPTWVTYNPSSAEHTIDPHRLQDKFNEALFTKLFPNRKHYPRYFGQACCSQFAVSRDAIQNVGLETFQRLYDWIDGMRSDWNSGRMMEMLWQYIFLERGISCPSVESCYCETYGLCYGRDTGKVRLVDSWNEHRARTDELNEQIVAANKQLREKLAFLRMMASKDPSNKQLVTKEPADEEAEFRQTAAMDPELIALWKDYEYVKQRSKELKVLVMATWGVEKSSEWW